MAGEYEVGFGRADITVWEPSMAMLGWGMFYNRTEGVAEPLFARAMVVRDSHGERVAYVCADLLIMSQAVRLGVLDTLRCEHPELGLDEARVMLTATHTHSAPAGYSHYFWINLGGPGYSRKVTEGVVRGIVAAILAADRGRRPGRLCYHEGPVPPDDGIAFNRSYRAYNRNGDVEPVTYERRAEALDGTMKLLRFDPDWEPEGAPGEASHGEGPHGEGPHGEGAGALCWFGLHGTCVHSDNDLLHPDHKGLACGAFEARTGVFGIFAQEAAGDVSPNHRYDDRRGRIVGRFDDDFESAAWVADVEAERAERIHGRAAREGVPLEGPLWSAIRYVDFGRAPIDRRLAEQPGAPERTGPPRLGISMTMGTAEGPGPLFGAPWIPGLCNGLARTADLLSGLRGRRRHDPKWPMLELEKGMGSRLMGLVGLRGPLLLPVDPITRYVRELSREGALDETPWFPQVVPVQILRVGSLAILALPFEPSTVAGRRLRRTLLEELAPEGVTDVVLNPYANAYAGYLTTFEEYQQQHYEAGYTVFGPWQLAAVRTAVASLARDMLCGGSIDQGIIPPRIRAEHVERQAFHKPWPAYGSPW